MRVPIFALALPLAFGAMASAASTNGAPTVTFNKEVLPILQAKCQECHRPGEAAPMSLISYTEARPWAKSIKQNVATKKMPPWFADPHVGKFANDRSLSQQEIDTLIAWVDAGAPEGNPKDAPAPRKWVDGWNIGKPDMVLEMPTAFSVPAKGVIDYQYIIIPTHLTEDKWIQAVEVVPSARSVMHHVIATIREPGSKWFANEPAGVAFVPQKGDRSGTGDGTSGLGGYVPGQSTPPTDSPHRATLIKAGSDIVLQLHYTTNGTPAVDQTKLGIIFAKEPPKDVLVGGNSATLRLNIPPGDPDYKVEASSTVQYDCDLVSMMPHSHLRGKAFEYRIVRPNGESETVLRVPKYDFNWQLTYYLAQPIHLEKGTKVQVFAEFDNSADNKYNPDPTKEVHWGEQTFEEMMMGYYNVVVKAENMPNGGMPKGRRPASKTDSGAALE
jgi:hypothetical protein